jgi:hypothetical protein
LQVVFDEGTTFALERPEGELMATAQPSKSTTSGSTKKTQGSRSSGMESQTGERDENYNLVSVLYHALQGAETISQYLRDAQTSSDQDLAQFFEETRGSYALVAQQAKQLLAERIESEDADEEDEDDDA